MTECHKVQDSLIDGWYCVVSGAGELGPLDGGVADLRHELPGDTSADLGEAGLAVALAALVLRSPGDEGGREQPSSRG